MLKGKQVVALILWVAASMVYAGNSEQYTLSSAAAQIALNDSNEQADPSAAHSRDPEQAQQAAGPAHREPPLPSFLQLRECAERDAVLTAQQAQLDAEEAVLRAEEVRLAEGKREVQALRSNGSKESLTQAERDWDHASAQLKKNIDNFDHLAAPYYAGVFYQVEHCAFLQVRRQDLQQLCQEGTYPRFCAKYQAFQTGE